MEIVLLALLTSLIWRDVRVGGVACGDSIVNGQELEFTCKLVNRVYLPNAAKIIKQRKKDPLTGSNQRYDVADVYEKKCTAVFIDYLPLAGLQRALFLTAKHCVKLKQGIDFEPLENIAVQQSWEYLKTPLTKDQVSEYMMQYKFYANLTVSCIDSELQAPMKRAMYAYPVEFMDTKSNFLQISKVLQYNSPLNLDIALIWTEVTPEFVHLFNKGGLRPIKLPGKGLTNIKILMTKKWYGADSEYLNNGASQYIVRAGGFGSTDPAECEGNPDFPCFANFAIDETAKLEFSGSKQLMWSSIFWPIDDGQVCARLIPEKCQRHKKAEHNPARGLRSACRGDSGGPAFVVNNGNPILVGIAATGVCTHEEPLPRVIHEIYSKYVLVSSLHVKNWIRVIKDALFHHLPHVDV